MKADLRAKASGGGQLSNLTSGFRPSAALLACAAQLTIPLDLANRIRQVRRLYHRNSHDKQRIKSLTMYKRNFLEFQPTQQSFQGYSKSYY